MKEKKWAGGIFAAFILLLPLLLAVVTLVVEGPTQLNSYFQPDLKQWDIDYGKAIVECKNHTAPIVSKNGITITQGEMELARLARENSLKMIEELISINTGDMKKAYEESKSQFDQSDAQLFQRLLQGKIIEKECDRLLLTVPTTRKENMWYDLVKMWKGYIADPNDLNHANSIVNYNRYLGIMKGMGYTEEQFAAYIANGSQGNQNKDILLKYFVNENGYSDKGFAEQQKLFDAYIGELVGKTQIQNPYV